jgi:polyisoprenoid-binding protein YceI
VGRTSGLEGGLLIAGTTISDVSIVADMTQLQSDSSRRDGALENRGLETATFPSASFELIDPIDLGSRPAEGDTITATASGALTLHGETLPIELPIEGQLVDADTIVVVGSVDIAFADWGIEAPVGLSVLSIADIGTIEMQLTFKRS